MHILGWKRQAIDHRDFHYKLSYKALAALPKKVDLSANMPGQLDQGNLGSCGPNSADECIQFDQKVQKLTPVSASRLFIYYVTRQLMGDVSQDSGVDNRTLLKAIAKYGYCPETLWPYDTSKFAVKPTDNCYAAAQPNTIKSYAAVPKNLAQMKACLASGFPFIFGFDVFQSMMSKAVAKTGVVPDPKKSATPVGGHDVTIFGYDDKTGRFKFRNHWVNDNGKPWGDNGNGYISYEYATGQYADDFWVINAVPGA